MDTITCFDERTSLLQSVHGEWYQQMICFKGLRYGYSDFENQILCKKIAWWSILHFSLWRQAGIPKIQLFSKFSAILAFISHNVMITSYRWENLKCCLPATGLFFAYLFGHSNSFKNETSYIDRHWIGRRIINKYFFWEWECEGYLLNISSIQINDANVTTVVILRWLCFFHYIPFSK